jgi:hypothetical protein
MVSIVKEKSRPYVIKLLVALNHKQARVFLTDSLFHPSLIFQDKASHYQTYPKINQETFTEAVFLVMYGPSLNEL